LNPRTAIHIADSTLKHVQVKVLHSSPNSFQELMHGLISTFLNCKCAHIKRLLNWRL